MKTKAMLLAVVGTALASGTHAMAEDAYVESDGTQYINLGYRLNPRSRVVYDFALTEAALSTDVRPIGARGGQNMRIYTGGDNGAFTLSFTVSKGTSTQSKNSTVAADTERHVATFDYGAAAEQCTVSLDDGAFSHTFTGVSTATSSQPLIVFAENLAAGGIYSEASASGYYLPAKARVYGVTIYEDGTEVLTVVKCRGWKIVFLFLWEDFFHCRLVRRLVLGERFRFIGNFGIDRICWLEEACFLSLSPE